MNYLILCNIYHTIFTKGFIINLRIFNTVMHLDGWIICLIMCQYQYVFLFCKYRLYKKKYPKKNVHKNVTLPHPCSYYIVMRFFWILRTQTIIRIRCLHFRSITYTTQTSWTHDEKERMFHRTCKDAFYTLQ